MLIGIVPSSGIVHATDIEARNRYYCISSYAHGHNISSYAHAQKAPTEGMSKPVTLTEACCCITSSYFATTVDSVEF